MGGSQRTMGRGLAAGLALAMIGAGVVGAAPSGAADDDPRHATPALQRLDSQTRKQVRDQVAALRGEQPPADDAGGASATSAAAAPKARAADPEGKTTSQETITGGDPTTGFKRLTAAPGEGRTIRDELAAPQGGRGDRRVSLTYFGQLTDFQVSDEESPARVEFFDVTADPPTNSPFGAAWRPQESVVAHGADQAIRQMNRFADQSPIADGDGERASLDLALMTGDLADNQHRNETSWVVTLLEGGNLDPNGGSTDDAAYNPTRGCPGPGPQREALKTEAPKYTGVQDYDDFGANPSFYDPDSPTGKWADWPMWKGLLDRAQQPFQAEGLKVPSYVTFGNHDGLVQGNQWANAAFEDIATGCLKAELPVSEFNPANFDIPFLAGKLVTNPEQVKLVPPDLGRQFVNKEQFKAVNAAGSQADAHGFGFVEPAELEASNGAASYYAFEPQDGITFIGIDTLSEGGIAGPGALGNIDDPQWQWLTGKLDEARKAGNLIVVFGHHPVRSLTSDIPDEDALCTGVQDPEFGHDENPGCDVDPRSSTPLHKGEDLETLLNGVPNVIAYVAGHTHENNVAASTEEQAEAGRADGAAGQDQGGIPDDKTLDEHSRGAESQSHAETDRPRRSAQASGHAETDHADDAHTADEDFTATAAQSDGQGYWGIETASLIDWPPQSRLIEVMNNCDGTLSIFGTTIDTQAPIDAPANGDASGFTPPQLGSIARTLSFNDPQAGKGAGDGDPEDRNVELLLDDPRAQATRDSECGVEASDTDGGSGAGGDDDETAGGGGGGSDDVSGDGGSASAPGGDDDTVGVASGSRGDGLPFTGMTLVPVGAVALLLVGAGLLVARHARGRRRTA